MSHLPLSALFPAATEDAWRAAVDKALKGGDFEKKLVNRSADGIAIQPLYPRAAKASLVAGARGAERWRLTQRLDHPDPDRAHAQVLADLEGGAGVLSLIFAGAASARGFGIALSKAADLDALLDGVMLDLIELRLETAPFAGRNAAGLVKELAKRRKLPPSALTLDLGLDPIGDMARCGSAPLPYADLAAHAAQIAADCASAGFKGHLLRIDARCVHEAGGSEAQELAYALASTTAYLRALEAGGFSLSEAMAALSFTLAVDADQFLGIAKLRALRKLVARVQEACGLQPSPIVIHAETAWRMLTRHDAPVNMLRNTIAVFSAGVGGADSIAVLPHSLAQGLPDAFARRVARNSQHVLMEESHLWRVVDPAAGSGGIEALTDELCQRGWALFQEIERAGGMVAALESELFQSKVKETSAAQEKAVATRRTPLTGTSEFPNLNEKNPDVIAGAVRRAFSLPAAARFAPLASHRLAEPYEALRDRADALLAKTGERPRIFMANLGPISAFTARTTFARALFEAGGLEAAGNDGFAQGDGTDLIALTDAFKASGAQLACLCSSDAVYAQEAADAALALGASGALKIYIAGRLPEMEAALAQAGVTGAIFVGCDVLKTLSEALDVAGS